MKKFTRIMLVLALSSAFFISQMSAQNILCVDNDLSDTSAASFTDCWPMFQASLDANGYTYDYMEVDQTTYTGPDATAMDPYDIVIWWTGEVWDGWQTLTLDDEFNLLLYLTLSNGKLLLSAQDYLWDRYPDAGFFDPGDFPYDQLGIIEVVQDEYHIEDDPDTARFNGAPGSIAEGLSFPVYDIFTTVTTDDGLYADSIAEHEGTALFTVQVPYVSTGTPGIQYETEAFRVIFTTLSFAAITDTDAADEFMYRMIDWLMYGAAGTPDLENPASNVLVHPNPAKDYVNIGMVTPMKEIRIINSQGQVVYHQDVNNIKAKIDVNTFPSGVYIVQAITANGNATNRLVVK